MILLDLDGVLADFTKAAYIAHGVPPKLPEERSWWRRDWQMDDDTFWFRIHQHAEQFYSRVVQPYPWAQQVVKMVDSADEFRIVTSVAGEGVGAAWGYHGKRVWVHQFFPDIPTHKVIVMNEKELMVGADPTGVLLIDDDPAMCDKFAEAGGTSFLFPLSTNTKAYPPSGPWWGNLEEVLAYWKDRNGPVKVDPFS